MKFPFRAALKSPKPGAARSACDAGFSRSHLWPHAATKDWTLALQFGGRLLAKWSWAEFEALPQTTIKTDIHCVTTWSKLDTTWSGVTFDDLLSAAGLDWPPAPFVMAHCDGAYTTNVPTADLVGGKGMMRAFRSCRLTAALLGCLSLISISGRAASGSGAFASWRKTNRAFGKATAITCMATMAGTAL